MKPYRLINTLELQKIQQFINSVLEEWNQMYAFIPFKAHISTVLTDPQLTEALMIKSNAQTVALVDRHYVSLTNHALFGQDIGCFNTSSQELFVIFLNQLFNTEHCSLHKERDFAPQWFYRGSTCLQLLLSCGGIECALILSPDWVYQQIPLNSIQRIKLSSLDAALSEQYVSLDLELQPIQLTVQQVLGLQIGDVITTDHPLTKALHLSQKEQLIAQAELGQSEQYKSIILKRSL